MFTVEPDVMEKKNACWRLPYKVDKWVELRILWFYITVYAFFCFLLSVSRNKMLMYAESERYSMLHLDTDYQALHELSSDSAVFPITHSPFFGWGKQKWDIRSMSETP